MDFLKVIELHILIYGDDIKSQNENNVTTKIPMILRSASHKQGETLSIIGHVQTEYWGME